MEVLKEEQMEEIVISIQDGFKKMNRHSDLPELLGLLTVVAIFAVFIGWVIFEESKERPIEELVAKYNLTCYYAKGGVSVEEIADWNAWDSGVIWIKYANGKEIWMTPGRDCDIVPIKKDE